jgi:hypothetical protein
MIPHLLHKFLLDGDMEIMIIVTTQETGVLVILLMDMKVERTLEENIMIVVTAKLALHLNLVENFRTLLYSNPLVENQV